MNIFCDYIGHADLDYSMHALFEKRLGAKVFRPDGFCWQKILEGTKHDPIHNPFVPPVNEIVVPHYIPCVSGPDLRGVSHFHDDDKILNVEVPTHGYHRRFITFEQFMDMKFDVLLTTYWGNESTFACIQAQWHKESKFVRQIANIHERQKITTNLMMATTEKISSRMNKITYFPEHPDLYYPTEPVRNMKVKSFLNNVTIYPDMLDQWASLKELMPEYSFKQYGMNNPDGSIPQAQLPDAMRDAMFIWHSKPTGCCGYVAREALACGKPIIANKSYAAVHSTLAVNYLEDGINLIDTNPAVRTIKEAVDIVRAWSKPRLYEVRCQAIIDHYKKKINFEKEAGLVQQWLNEIPAGG